MDVSKAILVLAAAVVFHALAGRYEVSLNGMRIDRLLGRIEVCRTNTEYGVQATQYVCGEASVPKPTEKVSAANVQAPPTEYLNPYQRKEKAEADKMLAEDEASLKKNAPQRSSTAAQPAKVP